MQSAVTEETRDRLRSAGLSRRDALSPASCVSWSRLIQTKTIELPQYRAASSVSLYCAVGKEVETRAIMAHAFRHGKKVFCPKFSQAGSAFFVQLNSDAGLIEGGFGVPEPAGEDRLSAPDCENLIVIVPGVLFDGLGNRLGRGGGWYDRALLWLGNRGVFVGLAYDCQVVDRLPAQIWDQKVHYVITESKVIDCGVASHGRIAR
jgi:5,10-methenyltetrahydrofolate synthetase